MTTTANIETKPFKITGNWQASAKRLKEKFPYLTDSDLRFIPGKENELISRIRSRLYIRKEEVIEIIEKTQAKIPIIDKYKLPKASPNRLLPGPLSTIQKPANKWHIKLSLLKYLL